MKKIAAISLVLLLTLALLAGCTTVEPGQAPTPAPEAPAPQAEEPAAETPAEVPDDTDRPILIGQSVLNLSNPFFIALSDAAKAYADQHGVEIMLNDAKDQPETQIAALENFIASGVDAIIVTAVDPEAVLPVVKRAREQGIVVICHTSQLGEYDAWVAADEYDMGYTLGVTAGEWIAENWGTDEDIQAATLNYDIMPQVIQRKIGIMEGVAVHAPNVEFVADAMAGDPQSGMEATENFIQAFPDLRVVLGINDGGALGAYEAFIAAGKDGDDYMIGGIDATPEGLNRVREGGIYRVTVDQAPAIAGAKTVELALAALRGEPFERDYLQDLVPVTFANVEDWF